MPTIELHGFLNDKNSLKEASLSNMAKDFEDFCELVGETERKIFEALEDTDFADEVVMSSFFSAVANFEEQPSPFLRVWATSMEMVDEIVKRLDPLDIDIEVAPLLLKFVPRRSAREAQNHPESGPAVGDLLDVVPGG